MNAKVSKMLRKTGRDSHGSKRWWNSLGKDERGQLRSEYKAMVEAKRQSVKM